MLGDMGTSAPAVEVLRPGQEGVSGQWGAGTVEITGDLGEDYHMRGQAARLLLTRYFL